MIGAPSTVSASEGEELRLRNCSGEIVSLSLEGNTVQDGTPEFVPSSTEQVSETYTESFVPITQADGLLKGFDEEYASLYTDSYPIDIFSKFPSNADSITLTLEPVGLTKFAGLTVAISSTWSANPSDYKNLYSCSSIDAGVTENYSDITINKADYPNGIYISIGDTLTRLTSTTEQICKEWWKVLTIIATTVVVTSITTPATIIPAPIINAGDGGLDVELSGVNLFDNSTRIFAQISTFESTDTGFNVISNVKNNVAYVVLQKIEAEAGKKYFIDFDCAFFNSAPTSVRPNELHIRASNNEGVSTTGDKLIAYPKLGTSEQTTHKRFSITMPSGYKYLKLLFYCSVISTTLVDYKAVFTNFIVSKDEEKPYQPYFAPVTVNIPSEVTLTDGTVVPLRFAKVSKADYMLVDKLNNSVKYVRNIGYIKSPKGTYAYKYNNMNGVQCANSLEQQLNRAKGKCTHSRRVGDFYTENSIWVGVSSSKNVYWVGIFDVLGITTVEEFNAWVNEQEANGTPVELLYELNTPIEYDLTDTDLGKQLLALAIPYGNDGIITFDSDGLLPSAVKCEYETIDDTLEDKLSLTIFYKDTEGNELAPSQVHLLRKDTSFSVVPIDIPGYMSMGSYEGVIKEDTEITIEFLGGSNESV
ncbi:MAG: MucBP domain-containing protein [Clostridia bacterium]|nr:MucBP domain-containing protein [Clostridia bacterium]